MIRVSRLRRQPHLFRNFTGLSPEEFDLLLSEFTPRYEASLIHKKTRPDRQRAVGAGRHFHLAVPERLLMCLIYLRMYVNQRLLSFLFDLDQSNVCREINQRLLPILLTVLPVPLRDAPLRNLSDSSSENEDEPPTGGKRRIRTLEELLRLHPEIKEVLVDATEQAVPQPEDKARRKQAYSGKQHDLCHTLVTQHD